MANLYTNNPMELDTPWTSTTIPAALLPPTSAASTSPPARNEPIEAKRIEWFNPATIGDVLRIEDVNGNPIIDALCEVSAGSQVVFQSTEAPVKLKMGGWVLKTIGSGKVIIYY
jgi:hypothetical protein